MLIWHVYDNANLFDQSNFAYVVMLAADISAVFIAHLMMWLVNSEM